MRRILQDMLEQLRHENELLHEDNNKLVAYIESLPHSAHPKNPTSAAETVPPGDPPSCCWIRACSEPV